jgi:hypothetical protein
MGWHKQGRDGDAALQAMAALQAPWFEFESNGLIVTVPSSEVQGYGALPFDFASSPVLCSGMVKLTGKLIRRALQNGKSSSCSRLLVKRTGSGWDVGGL